MTNEPRILADGFLSLEGGVDGGRPPSVLTDIQVHAARNASFRGGYPHRRPTVKPVEYTFGTGAKDACDTLKFQGAGSFVETDGSAWIWLSLSGRIFRVNITSADAVLEEPNPAVVNNSNLDKAWFLQADRFLLIQDGQGPCIVYDGVTVSANTAGQIPVGTRMAYGLGRIWIADGRNYVGGDLIYSDPAKGAASILYFTENEYLAEGGKFSIPASDGEITGLAFTAVQDSASGEGSLMVFTAKGIYEFSAPVDRTVWRDLQAPVQRFSLLNFGATSHECIVPVNGDLFFRAEDGIRSFYFARRDFGTWGNTPISREVGNILSKDQRTWLTYANGANFDNRVLMTAQPERTARGTIHHKLVVLDFDLVSGMRSKLPPAWEGEWTFNDFSILQVLTVDTAAGRRCILVVLNSDNEQIQLWEMVTEGEPAQPVEEVDWAIDTKSYQFSDPMGLKSLRNLELWLDDIQDALTVQAFYKSNNSGCWVPWAQYETDAESCVALSVAACVPPTFPQSSGRSRVGFGLAPDSVNATDCEQRRYGYEFQVRLKLNNPAYLKKMRLTAKAETETANPRPPTSCTAIVDPCQTC